MTGGRPSTTVNHSVPQQSPLDAKETLMYGAGSVYSVSRDHAQWRGVEGEKQRTSNLSLRDFKFEIRFGGTAVT